MVKIYHVQNMISPFKRNVKWGFIKLQYMCVIRKIQRNDDCNLDIFL